VSQQYGRLRPPPGILSAPVSVVPMVAFNPVGPPLLGEKKTGFGETPNSGSVPLHRDGEGCYSR
jgi:hypothetical protein